MGVPQVAVDTGFAISRRGLSKNVRETSTDGVSFLAYSNFQMAARLCCESRLRDPQTFDRGAERPHAELVEMYDKWVYEEKWVCGELETTRFRVIMYGLALPAPHNTVRVLVESEFLIASGRLWVPPQAFNEKVQEFIALAHQFESTRAATDPDHLLQRRRGIVMAEEDTDFKEEQREQRTGA